MKQTLLLLALVAGLSACATNKTDETVADARASDEPTTRRECKYERTTSSRLGNKVCRDVPVTE